MDGFFLNGDLIGDYLNIEFTGERSLDAKIYFIWDKLENLGLSIISNSYDYYDEVFYVLSYVIDAFFFIYEVLVEEVNEEGYEQSESLLVVYNDGFLDFI